MLLYAYLSYIREHIFVADSGNIGPRNDKLAHAEQPSPAVAHYHNGRYAAVALVNLQIPYKPDPFRRTRVYHFPTL